MQQFDLSLWFQDKSRKVVTRDGKPVRIVCWDKLGNYPIIGCIKYSDDYEYFESFTIKGSKYTCNCEDTNDLFFADEEKCNKILNELKSYFKSTPKEQIEKDWKEIQDWYAHYFANENHNEEEELTEFEKMLRHVLECYSGYEYASKSDIDTLKLNAKTLLDPARKELLKDLPK